MKKSFLFALALALTCSAAHATNYGPELVTDGGFDESDAHWDLGYSWQTIPGLAFHNEGYSLPISQSTVGVHRSRLYEASYTISGSYTSTHPMHVFRLMGSFYTNCPMQTGDGTFTCQLLAPPGVHTLMIQPSSGFAGVLDNVSLREVLP